MENDIIYFSDFPNLQETGTRKDNGKFDLTLLPTQELKEEFRGYIMYRCKNGTFRALIQDRTAYNHIAKFLNSRINRRIKSLGDRNPEKWISLLKGWMLEQGITIVKEKKSVYGTVSYGEAVTILYFRNVLKFLGPEDLRDEIEKDVWELKNLDIKIRSNPIYNVKTLDFRKIYQPDIREECKKAVYMNLQYEAIGTVQGELTIMRIFSEYLQKEYSKIKSCSEIDREVLEEFLIHLSTKDTSHSANSSYVISLRRQLETIGKIYSYVEIISLMYPCNTTKQQEYWKHIAEKNQNPDFEPMLRKKISELEYRERYTVKKEFFLQFFWKTEAEIKSGRKAIESVMGVRKLHGECGITELLEEISPTKKEQVLFKIANKNSQIF